MSLDDTVDRLIKKNDRFRKAVEDDPSLKYKLSEIVDQHYKDNKGTLWWAKFVDGANRVLGTATAGLRATATIGGPVAAAYMATKLLHYGLIKLPYIAYYTLAKDKKGGGLLAAAEVLKYSSPWPAALIAEWAPIYRMAVEHYLSKESAREFNTYLDQLVSKKEVEGESKADTAQLYLIQDNVKIPRELVIDYGARISNGKMYIDVPSRGYEVKFRPLEDGMQEVYLDKKKGDHPQVLTTLEVALPTDTKALKFPDQGFKKEPLLKVG